MKHKNTVKAALKPRKLGAKEKAALALVALASIALFASTALSDLQNYVKAPALILELVLTGLAIQRITGLEGYAGIIMVRAKRGFEFMDELARKIALPAKLVSEAGLSIGFGVLYAIYVFRGSRGKLLAYSAAAAAFFLFLTAGAGQARAAVLLLSFLFGLAGLGVFSLATQALNILTIPSAAPGVYPIIPGLTPGIPLAEGIIALIVIVVVHELAHGVLCRVEGLELKSDGMLFFGFLPIGAFVEPDEERLKRLAIEKRRRIFSAGSTSNLVFFFVFLALALVPATLYPFTVDAVVVKETLNASPAEGRLFAGDVVLAADGAMVKNSGELGKILKAKREGDAITILISRPGKRNAATTAMNFTLTLGKEGKLGIVAEDLPKKGFRLIFESLVFAYRTFFVTYTLNFALALVNLLPLFVTDGHRILEDELISRLGRKRKKLAKKIAAVFGAICLALIIINIAPWFR